MMKLMNSHRLVMDICQGCKYCLAQDHRKCFSIEFWFAQPFSPCNYLAQYRCSALDDLLNPIRTHLSPRLSDAVMIAAVGGAAKRIEAAI